MALDKEQLEAIFNNATNTCSDLFKAMESMQEGLSPDQKKEVDKMMESGELIEKAKKKFESMNFGFKR